MKVLRNKKGFTMIELMIVAIIVAILAVVLIPLMSANKYRAYATEAEAALGTIRTAMRVYQAENGDFPTIAAGTDVEGSVPGIAVDDLDGTYFSGPNYTVTSTPTAATTTVGSYSVTCTWNDAGNTAPQAEKVNGLAFTTILYGGADQTVGTETFEDVDIDRNGY